MSRDTISLSIEDVSAFAKALRHDLSLEVGHQSVLNAVARAAGFRNHQHLVAKRAGVLSEPPINHARLTRALRWFDDAGRLTAWPSKYSLQQLCLITFWARMPPRTVLSEREISDLFHKSMAFRDAAQVRRGLVDVGLVTRTADGSAYTRVERRPDPTERALIARVLGRA